MPPITAYLEICDECALHGHYVFKDNSVSPEVFNRYEALREGERAVKEKRMDRKEFEHMPPYIAECSLPKADEEDKNIRCMKLMEMRRDEIVREEKERQKFGVGEIPECPRWAM